MKTIFSRIISPAILLLLLVFTANAQTNADSNKENNTDKKQEKLKNNENADDNTDCPETGIVRLRVTFDKSGEITKTEIVLSGGCKFFDEKALEAAKKIKFEPAKKNGKKVTSVKLVEYTFTKY